MPRRFWKSQLQIAAEARALTLPQSAPAARRWEARVARWSKRTEAHRQATVPATHPEKLIAVLERVAVALEHLVDLGRFEVAV